MQKHYGTKYEQFSSAQTGVDNPPGFKTEIKDDVLSKVRHEIGGPFDYTPHITRENVNLVGKPT